MNSETGRVLGLKVTRVVCRWCKGLLPAGSSGYCSEACLKLDGPREARRKRIQNRSIRSIPAPKRATFQCKRCNREIEKQQGNGSHAKGICQRSCNRKKGKAYKQPESTPKRKVIKPAPQGFYETTDWQNLRYRALKFYGRRCMLCGAQNVELHVDHIKPRSKYPELQLEFSNLQILCRPCNMGKSNLFEDDWRLNV